MFYFIIVEPLFWFHVKRVHQWTVFSRNYAFTPSHLFLVRLSYDPDEIAYLCPWTISRFSQFFFHCLPPSAYFIFNDLSTTIILFENISTYIIQVSRNSQRLLLHSEGQNCERSATNSKTGYIFSRLPNNETLTI